MAEYLPYGNDTSSEIDGDYVEEVQSDLSCDKMETTDHVTEDISLLQVFLPHYSEKSFIDETLTHVVDESNALFVKKDTSSEDTFLDLLSKHFESLKVVDPLYLKIIMEILLMELTEEQFSLNLPRYYQCNSSFIHQSFSSKSHNTSVREYLDWVSKNRKVKGNCNEIPYGILPKGISAEITDVRVNCYGVDDRMYETNQVLREKVARGNSFVTFFGKDVVNSGCVIRGLKKFSGGYWDDDDIQHTDHSGWSRYFLSPPTTATSVVVMEKVNGEAAHVSARLLGSKFFIFCGSKNVHLLVSRRQHLLKYQEQRYSYACIIGEAFFDILEGLSEYKRVRLLSFLAHTGFTAIFELLQPNNQHIVNLSHLSAPVLKFITWVPSDIGGVNCICSLPPDISIDLATYLSLPTARYSVIQLVDLPKELVSVRASKQCEGTVLYFMNNKREVIGLMKFKSIWYIILRAVREIIKFHMSQISKGRLKCHEAKSKGAESIEKRFHRINKSLNLKSESYLAWREICTEFLKWVIDITKFGKSISFSSNFPNMWERFLKEKTLKEPPILRKSL